MRAYPAKAKKSNPAGLEHAARRAGDRASRPRAVARRRGSAATTTTGSDSRVTATTTRARGAVFLTPAVRSRSARARRRPRPARTSGPRRRERQRHRRAARELADHEAPPGEEAPERAEPLAAVDVRAAGLRVDRGERATTSRCSTRPGGDHEADEQRGAATSRPADRAKTPAPIIAPSPITTASPSPSRRRGVRSRSGPGRQGGAAQPDSAEAERAGGHRAPADPPHPPPTSLPAAIHWPADSRTRRMRPPGRDARRSRLSWSSTWCPSCPSSSSPVSRSRCCPARPRRCSCSGPFGTVGRPAWPR